ncbi:MAG: glycosyltransferase family 4 protein [Acidobacteriota bacterium]|nr:glycosyltransferase family 4 protein [Acidobacteriota bacterium]
MRKKIVLLGPYPPPYGGVSIYIQTLYELFKDRAVEFWIFGDEEFKAPNIRFMKDKRRQLLPLVMRRGANARIADCTHFFIEYPSILVPAWVVLKRLLRFEWIKVMQDGSLPSRYKKFNPFRKALFRLAAQSVTEFIVISEELEHWLRGEIRVGQNISLIKNLFPIPYRSAPASLPEKIERALLPYQRSGKRVCSIGVFIPSYGFKHVVAAVEKLRHETGTDIGLLLLDGDFAADEDYRIDVLKGRDWITVLKNVAHPFVFEILRRSDVFVRGFGLDSYGLSRVEAIWCGLPVVATRAGETRGMLLYDFGDEEELACQLNKALFNQPSEEAGMWAATYQREAEDNFQKLVSKLDLEPVIRGESIKPGA